ncbi:MAG: heme A synthase [Actinobacteria bacterium]|nr:heme A synthase [Actinomycetota bacterium]MCB9412386.1 heme A synthase [Actinomycetota bacterium]
MAVVEDRSYVTAQPTDRTAPTWLRRIFVANLVAQTGIVITGGLVRLTGSGLGCPTWPQCAPGSFTPTETQAESWHKYVEFGNRLLTFVLGVLAIAAIVGALAWARRLRQRGAPPRRPITLLAAVPLLGTLAQAILGGITVLTGLNPATVAAHFLVSMVIIAFTLTLVWRAGEPGDEPKTPLGEPAVRMLSKALVAVGFVVLVMGTMVTGAGPHSGDAETPARLGIDPAQMSWLHADVVLLFIGLTVGLLVALTVTKAPVKAIRATWILFGIAMAQGVVGYVQYFTGLPWLVVLLHLLGACLVWIALLRIPLALRTRGVDQIPA